MDFIPTNESDIENFAQNFADNIDDIAKILGLDATETAAAKDGALEIISKGKAHRDAVTKAKTAKADKHNAVTTGVTKFRSIAKTIKSNKGYTPAMGKKLQIIGTEDVFNPSTYKPILTTRVMPGRVVIEFVKSKLNGVNVYVRLKGETTWTKLAYDTYSPYEDNRPLAQAGVPEHREYMVIGVIHDEEVTLQSDIVEAVYAG